MLAESGVDLIMCEMLNYSEASLKIIEMVLTTSLPVFAGVSASIRPDYAGQLDAFRTPNKLKNLNREPFEDLVKNVAGTGISAMAVMHTKPALMDSALKKLRKYWQGSAMAYAETGEFSDERWCFENAIDTHTYAQLVAEWNEKYNLQIVGGCCGTTINHTHDMNSRLT